MLSKIERAIKEFKKKQNPKVIGVTAFFVFGLVTLIMMNSINIYGREKQENTDTNNRNMYEIITSVNNIDVLVTKLKITKTSEYNLPVLSKIMAEASRAKDNLSALPVNQSTLNNVSKFFTQVISFSEVLIAKEANLDEKDYKNIDKIGEVADKLNNTLSDIYTRLTEGKIKWDEVEKVATEELTKDKAELNLEGINNIASVLEDYEGLIYDGAFSEHIVSNKAKNLTGKDITVEEAAEKVKECVINLGRKEKYEIKDIKYNGEINGNIPLLDFNVKCIRNNDEEEKIEVDVQITKQESKLLLILSDRDIKEKKLDVEACKQIGDEYLKELGLKNFDPTYYLEANNMVTINYAAVQDGVLLYPDLIKVKVAMDNGDICSVECSGYIYNHTVRTDITPTISESEVKSKINKDVEIKSIRLAVIPKESKEEVLTYEIKGKIDEHDVLIYINAKDGREENVLLILETPGGILTM